jgi:alkylhydroperoxidase family enzyme
MAAVWEFEQSSLFDERERAALAYAFAAGQVPNAVTDEIYTRLADNWDEDEIVEILGVICMFGVFNRWNDSMATALEEDAISVGQTLLADHDWEVGKHA